MPERLRSRSSRRGPRAIAAETDQREQEGQFAAARSAETAARAAERQVQQKLGAKVGSDYAQVAQVRA